MSAGIDSGLGASTTSICEWPKRTIEEHRVRSRTRESELLGDFDRRGVLGIAAPVQAEIAVGQALRKEGNGDRCKTAPAMASSGDDTDLGTRAPDKWSLGLGEDLVTGQQTEPKSRLEESIDAAGSLPGSDPMARCGDRAPLAARAPVVLREPEKRRLRNGSRDPAAIQRQVRLLAHAHTGTSALTQRLTDTIARCRVDSPLSHRCARFCTSTASSQ